MLNPPSSLHSPLVKRALLSVSNKDGIVDLAKELHEREVEIIATGGTAKALHEAGVPSCDVSEVTDFPEMMDGRLKTLHPRIHGGLLARRESPDHCKAMSDHDIENIDLLVVNLYPFEETLKRTDDEAELIENTDIGGPAMIRAAAKNHDHVCVLTSPEEYDYLLSDMHEYNGATSDALRRYLAALAFHRTSRYDAAISEWMKGIMHSYLRANQVANEELSDSINRLSRINSNFQEAVFKCVETKGNKWEEEILSCLKATRAAQKRFSDDIARICDIYSSPYKDLCRRSNKWAEMVVRLHDDWGHTLAGSGADEIVFNTKIIFDIETVGRDWVRYNTKLSSEFDNNRQKVFEDAIAEKAG